MGTPTNVLRPDDDDKSSSRDELHAIRVELTKLRKTIDAFAGVFLNANYPHGRPTDRWPRG